MLHVVTKIQSRSEQQKHIPLVAAQVPVIAICVASPPARHNCKFWRLYATDVKNHFYIPYRDEQDEIDTLKPPSIGQNWWLVIWTMKRTWATRKFKLVRYCRKSCIFADLKEVPKPLCIDHWLWGLKKIQQTYCIIVLGKGSIGRTNSIGPKVACPYSEWEYQ